MADNELDDFIADFDLPGAPGHLLRRNHQRSYEIFNRHVGDDVTRQQIALLIALAKLPGASQRDLVDATGIDKSTLKEMLGRMVARKWVERRRDPKDSRAWTLKLAEEGMSLLKERMAQVVTAQAEILAPLAPEDQRKFLRYLRILIGFDGPDRSR
ncbi:MarR family winged helix-turn-helix transcriptional regulator [Sphingomonas sp. HH69]|uniref:MarR family winged helix-turn-helix transcriptional regulator n=1 Tax=Sphingobium TaxID=165695 RepID=UPI0012FD9E77|nr:MarR family winged helix-turn-helix transcriptional regulator [Sphingobium sp. LB126]